MHSCKCLRILPAALILSIIFIGIAPVCAQNTSVSIAYWGAGGYYIGDNIIFNGKDLLGNRTMIRISGPGLSSEGVPAMDLVGTPGTGTYVAGDQYGSYIYSWDTSRAVGNDYLQTARYTVTVYDENYPDLTSSTSVMLKKPEFYAAMTPNPTTPGSYVQITGEAEDGADTVQIDILAASGSKVHTYITPVSGSGYFQYGFHIDMVPGEYTVKISSPTLGRSMTKTLYVAASSADIVNGTIVTPTTVPVSNVTPAADTGSLSVTSTPTGASIYLDSVPVGNTPYVLDSVSAGTHAVELELPGYVPYAETVVITSDQQTTISPNLSLETRGAPLSPVVAVTGCFVVGLLVFLRSRKTK
ncbi:MAG: PEGA domain-containing protein [Methanoregula sp.]|jgi:hypothetical protein